MSELPPVRPGWPAAALDVWHFTARERTKVPVAPDGCRDLIVRVPRMGAPTGLVSALADTLETPNFAPGDRAFGVRLRPGARIDETALLALVRGGERVDDADLMDAVGAATAVDSHVHEALDCLREASPLWTAHRRLGLSERRLERLLSEQTRRAPLWWRNLARARRCARALAGATPLAHLAAEHGYADQAHMARDLRRWFGAPATRLRAMPAFLATFDAPAYA